MKTIINTEGLLESKTVIFLMGPTASGKTDFVIELANKLPITIISVDSTLIYQTMDIGTAKPSAQILAQYPHHLINICQPYQPYCVSEFTDAAKEIINNAFLANKIPVLVGGTSFYFHALEYGLSAMPESSRVVRNELIADVDKYGLDYLYQKLIAIDKISANKIHNNDKQRIMRALEVFYISGNTLSDLQKNELIGGLQTPIKKIILMPKRELIHKRIAQRFQQMLADGFIDEVIKLRNNPKITQNMQAMRAVGYRQAWQYLAGDISKDEMTELSIIATRQLCKRQSTWLRSEKNALVLDNSDINLAIDYVNNK